MRPGALSGLLTRTGYREIAGDGDCFESCWAIVAQGRCATDMGYPDAVRQGSGSMGLKIICGKKVRRLTIV